MNINTSGIDRVIFNGTEVDRVLFNGAEVFSSGEISYVLPDTFQRVEYIETSGNAGIVTDVTVNKDTKITFVATVTNYTPNFDDTNFLFSTRKNTNTLNGRCDLIAKPDGTVNCNIGKYNNINEDKTLYGINHNYTKHIYVVDTNEGYCKVDGVDACRINTSVIHANWVDSNTPIALFCANYGLSYGTNHSPAVKFYLMTVKKDGVSTDKLVPCYRKQDGQIGVYNLVTNKFFTSVGDGTVTKGADIN